MSAGSLERITLVYGRGHQQKEWQYELLTNPSDDLWLTDCKNGVVGMSLDTASLG